MRKAAEDTIVQVTLQSTLLHHGAGVLAVDKMSRCGLLPGKHMYKCALLQRENLLPNLPVECQALIMEKFNHQKLWNYHQNNLLAKREGH